MYKIKSISAFVLGASLGLVPFTAAAESLEDLYFTNDNPALNSQEINALEVAKQFQARSLEMKPFHGTNGSIKYVFGAQEPNIVCAVLQVCDVALQAGETVQNIQLGDTARWLIEPAISGSGYNQIQHLMIKPLDVGLNTSLVVSTDRRIYHMKLKSHRSKYMPQVSFSYPEEALAKWDLVKKKEIEHRENNTIPQTKEYLGDLDFEYSISGNAQWKPVRVFNDGVKTIIQMPPIMKQTEAPTLLVVRRDGGLFSDDETQIVNYRLQGDRFIVDKVFNKAILISGVGKHQQKITITRGK